MTEAAWTCLANEAGNVAQAVARLPMNGLRRLRDDISTAGNVVSDVASQYLYILPLNAMEGALEELVEKMYKVLSSCLEHVVLMVSCVPGQGLTVLVLLA